jgi:membrane-bound lytic murein transglycosylase MltF
MVASEPYINIPKIEGEKNVENNVHAGVKYLSWIKRNYFDRIPEMSETVRIRMSLAAYNAGPNRLRRAIRKTKKLGLNPHKWFGHVERTLITMRRIEPVMYVSDINRRYFSYSLLASN